ncbi:hypothetical protein B0H14DRAFT_3007586 [Mycena olivaceomarginata]|nr:hypothetical protein B0H14DRAFT_3007586 [Mycena olivaceomarginata]
MESDPTDELLTIIGVFTLFFALDTTLPKRSRQADWAACGKAEHVWDHGDRGVPRRGVSRGCFCSFSSPSRIYALTPCRNTQEPQSGCTNTWWTFSKRQCGTCRHRSPAASRFPDSISSHCTDDRSGVGSAIIRNQYLRNL